MPQRGTLATTFSADKLFSTLHRGMNGLNFQSHRTQLVVTALAASLATAGLFSLFTTYSKREKRRKLGRDVQQSIGALDEGQGTSLDTNVTVNAINSARPAGTPFTRDTAHDAQPEELIREQLARNYAFFDVEGMKKIRNATVVVVGCGGVGSWAAVMLVRSWVTSYMYELYINILIFF
jgi:tRNA threonylcarbamoyladenosine dehydratase